MWRAKYAKLLVALALGGLLIGLALFVYADQKSLATNSCDEIRDMRYIRAIAEYERERKQHKKMFNVDTEVTRRDSESFGDCRETRFLVQETSSGPLTHYVGYIVVGDSTESFHFFACRGKDDCEKSAWCPDPEFGPSVCGPSKDGTMMCTGDLGFRGCTQRDS